jgi:hypothetical protein
MPYCSSILASMKPIDVFHIKTFDMDEIAKAEVRTIDDVIEEYHMIKSKFGEKGLDDFVKNICNISGRPTIDGYGMLIYISQEWENKERKYAL